MKRIDLSGAWLIRPDPTDQGLQLGWNHVDSWPAECASISVPAASQTVLGPDHKGIAWLSRRVAIPPRWAHPDLRLRLCFDSIATDATIFVNGINIGRHIGDYTPFQFDITDAVPDSSTGQEVQVIVRIDQLHAPRPAPGTLTELGHITKGFHDVLSLQHSGIWCDCYIRRSGPASLAPSGLRIRTDSARRSILIRAEFDAPARGQHISFTIRDRLNRPCGAGSAFIDDDATHWEGAYEFKCRADHVLYSTESGEPERLNLGHGLEDPRARAEAVETVPIELWSPDSPNLYTIVFDIVSGSAPAVLNESHEQRFAFRSITTGGSDNRNILLNDHPLLIRGVLHWGHEPDHIAPAPSPDQVRDEFTRLRALGFNCVCLCMWYPPEYYFDIADETGMLLWQEHPVWKSAMRPDLNAEYKRLFEGFFRRDARHPSVIIVSGSCEHESFDKELAAWWWDRARQLLPDKLLQLQTAFIHWGDPAQTDLYDEHVYDTSGRWVHFVSDVESSIRDLASKGSPLKPFIMGETIIGTDWLAPNPAADAPAWWHPKGVAECRAFEHSLASRFGAHVRDRFIETAHRHNVLLRKFQSEVLRTGDRNAGWVMNQIRDVPVGRLGFMDDFGRWRFTPGETLPWLSDAAILLKTQHHRRAIHSSEVEIGLSNYSNSHLRGPITLHINDTAHSLPIDCPRGDVRFTAVFLPIPPIAVPTPISLRATSPGAPDNAWTLWRFPPPAPLPPNTFRLDGLPYSAKELEPDFEDRAYSSGWGLPCRTWAPILPLPEHAFPTAPAWKHDSPIPRDAHTIISHRLTPPLLDFLSRGGNVLLLANKSAAGLSAKFINIWGQSPLIDPAGLFSHSFNQWVLDTLHIDLLERHPRAIAVDQLKISDAVQPLIRLIFTHDRGIPTPFDIAFDTRIGPGRLIAAALDPTTQASTYLLHLLLHHLSSPPPQASLSPTLFASLSQPTS